MTQAFDYARAIKNSGKILGDPDYVCYVLGSTIDPDLFEPMNQTRVRVQCLTYDALLDAAEARLFGLMRKFEEASRGGTYTDPISKLIADNPTLF